MSFAYDALNRCVKRTLNGNATYYCYANWNLIEEHTANGNLSVTYVHGANVDEMLIKTDTNSTVFYHEDALGNVTHLTDKQGNLVEQYRYDAFGMPIFIDANGNIISSSAYGNRFLFTGREWLQEIALYDYRNRIYSVELGRFLQTDPLGFDAGDANLYRYCFNNPVNLTDPIGLTAGSNLSFLADWFMGRGSNDRSYGPGDVETNEMANSPGGRALRAKFYNGGCKDVTGFDYGSGRAAWDTLINPGSADWTGTGAQVGGFAGASAIRSGETVTFTIPNTAGTHSFFYHVVPDRTGNTGPMRNIKQDFIWNEKIDKCKCKK